jgi:chromosome segregation ATPase
MAGMRRSDRHTDSYDNERRYPRSRPSEPASYRDLEGRLITVRSQRDEAQKTAQVKAEEAQRNHQLYLEEQEKRQTTLTLYHETQREVDHYLALYNQEKTHSLQWQTKYEEAEAQSQHYLTLYQEAQTELKFERRSKAGIKGWETRRRRENERLKQEIADMMGVLRDSMARESAAADALEEVADRMGRIQSLVDSVEADTSDHPLGLLQKFQRIWQAVKDILAE